MGILDGDINDQGLLGLYLMAAGAAKPQRTSFGEGLLGGIQMVQQRRMQKEDREAQKRLREMQIGLLGEQVNETRAQAKEREARAMQLAQAQRAQQEFASALGSVGQTTPSQALAGGGGPTLGNAAMIGQPRAIDWQALALKYPSQVDLIAKLAETRNLGRDEVARTIDTTDERGLPVTRQATKYGDLVGSVLPKPVEPKEVRQGDRVSFVNPYTSGALPIFQSPDSKASVAATLLGQKLADSRAREANSINREAQRVQIINDPVRGPLLVDKGTGVTRQARDASGNPVDGEKMAAERKNAGDVVALLNKAETLIPKSTGSYAGAGLDLAGRVVGYGTDGATAIAELKAIEGSLLSKMPRLEGPQSNYDRESYQQAAGELANPTLPRSVRMKALATVREINQRYGGAQSKPAAPSLDDLLKKYGN